MARHHSQLEPVCNYRPTPKTFTLLGAFITLGPTKTLTQTLTVREEASKSAGLQEELRLCEGLGPRLPPDQGQLIPQFLDFLLQACNHLQGKVRVTVSSSGDLATETHISPSYNLLGGCKRIQRMIEKALPCLPPSFVKS